MTSSKKPLYVLGTGLSHDGSACLLKDGRICVAIEKERITRRKHDGLNDTAAIQYCLDAEGISLNDVALVVQNANFGMLKHGNDWWHGPRLLNNSLPVITISHHLAHAYSAIGTSQFEDAAIIIIDGCGSGLDDCIDLDGAIVTENPPEELRHLYFEKDSYYTYKNGKLTTIFKDFSPSGASLKGYPLYPPTTMHSIGGLYLAVSMYVFRGFEDPGKLMGLAPYGRPGVYDFEIFELKDGRVYVRYDWMSNFDRPCRNPEQFKDNFQYYADIAYWVQREVERAILYVFNSRYELAPSDLIAYAGGVALNAVANRRILTETKFKDIYIHPAAGDNGVAVGCAYYGWLEILKKERVLHSGSMALGKPYPAQSIREALATHSSSLKYSEEENSVKKTAELLAQGKIVGWFQGGSEFGPRALGHRSILADPRKPETRHFINSNIKFREDFRPFAPSVLEEDVSIYFNCNYTSRYMILIADVKPEWAKSMPSIIHEDQSARIQTVAQSISPKYHQLLCDFKKITGISVLLNTSFNRRGMPIVETPEEAIRFFLNSDLDLLVIDNFVIYKGAVKDQKHTNITDKFIQNLRAALENSFAVGSGIAGTYRFDITGARAVTIDLSTDNPVIVEGVSSTKSTAIIEIAESDIDDFWNDPQGEGLRLIQDGKVKINGPQGKVMKLVNSLRLV
jgi:carbamoyltransferase